MNSCIIDIIRHMNTHMYLYVCIYTHTHIYIYIYIHVHRHIYPIIFLSKFKISIFVGTSLFRRGRGRSLFAIRPPGGRLQRLWQSTETAGAQDGQAGSTEVLPGFIQGSRDFFWWNQRFFLDVFGNYYFFLDVFGNH